ncbi:hypothetical protein T492DRAFT_1025518 [Pavlovales sp. CCMP2436]|nr:hypothetical protein T492DRAFT_1025518 [Pavlovales sp. CCMP2436]
MACAGEERVVLHLGDSASVNTYMSTLHGAESLAQLASQSAGHLHLPEMTSWCAAIHPHAARVPTRVRASTDACHARARRSMMIVMNFLRGQKASALKRMVRQAAREEQERLRVFATDHGLTDLLTVFKPDAASFKLPAKRRAQVPAWDPAAFKSDGIAFKPVPHLGRTSL